ncbi:orotate phosphoribosyltransferase [Enhygromyxa salina]|uniref:Orotate phosphoribosyltransferase n=1 Tax=Enhygromyxa salina TaxID=215803 RepID=A0A2S9XWB7_9BACT|nr:orotate phosphoribosyltransferase [Enhygromyxa salina]PRP97133.1 Orotate phosphoribosyltransferase [Enhygromyxa salina]
MQPHQQAFVDLLIRYEVVRFGEFTLKSGRKSPYFVNAGQLRTGRAIAGLGRAYAAEIQRAELACDLVFGPAYKGVPLAVATAIALAELPEGGRDVPYGFDRKEAKDHGEGGNFVGTAPAAGMKVVLVDDVITSGRSIREAVELLRAAAPDVEVGAAIVAVDRQERGRGQHTTLRELRDELGVDVRAIVSISELVPYLHGREINGKVVLDDAGRAAIEAYLAEHAGLS